MDRISIVHTFRIQLSSADWVLKAGILLGTHGNIETYVNFGDENYCEQCFGMGFTEEEIGC